MLEAEEHCAERNAIKYLEALMEPCGPFSFFDIHFARLVCRRAAAGDDYGLYLAALLAAYVVNRRRQVCLFLRQLPKNLVVWLGVDLDRSLSPDAVAGLHELDWPSDWEGCLNAHSAVAGPAEASSCRHLLVLDEGRLYLQRYWAYEQSLSREICRRVTIGFQPPCGLRPLADIAPRFGAVNGAESVNLQAAAVLAGLGNRFTVISGGPGCGKTSIVAAIAAVGLEIEPGLRIALCAPTGLAQARLTQALSAEIGYLNCADEVRERLGRLPAATLHRLLGYRPGEGFRYHAGRRLEIDLLIVDEASMVPLWIMSSLFAALPENCRVILLGDRNQLASVEAGAVLADICQARGEGLFSQSFMSQLDAFTGEKVKSPIAAAGPESAADAIMSAPTSIFRDQVVELKKSYRFSPDGGIARLQRAILGVDQDDGRALLEILAHDPSGEVTLRRLPPPGAALETYLMREIPRLTVEFEGKERFWGEFVAATSVTEAFACFKTLRLLAPLRRGPCGSERLNRLAAGALGLAETTSWPPGKPLLITRNQPRLNLYNGDVGLLFADGDSGVQAWFEQADGLIGLAPSRLPAFESAFAVTVHKAQGAGFQKVVILWPERDSPLLTREMLYTAVTRAARRVEIWLPDPGRPADLVKVCRRRVERSSGLLPQLQKELAGGP